MSTQQIKDIVEQARSELSAIKANLEGSRHKLADEAAEIELELGTMVGRHLESEEPDDPFALKLAMKDIAKRCVDELAPVGNRLNQAVELL